mmetsp:Transcript_32670/g.69615  ORF Transcript_32670/g.69615 Transcript_32670/m.69615 type:complete len:97 (-) Transcript_32670:154-444(-)
MTPTKSDASEEQRQRRHGDTRPFGEAVYSATPTHGEATNGDAPPHGGDAPLAMLHLWQNRTRRRPSLSAKLHHTNGLAKLMTMPNKQWRQTIGCAK